MFAAFLPAISRDALKDKGRTLRRWRINLGLAGCSSLGMTRGILSA